MILRTIKTCCPTQQKLQSSSKPIPIRFVQTKLTPDERDALGGYGKYASGQKTATDTPDAGIDVKDEDPNTSWHPKTESSKRHYNRYCTG